MTMIEAQEYIRHSIRDREIREQFVSKFLRYVEQRGGPKGPNITLLGEALSHAVFNTVFNAIEDYDKSQAEDSA